MSATFSTPEGLLTIREACGLLKVSRSTFWKLRNEHNLPVVRVGGLPRIRPSDLERWIQRHVEGNGEATP